MLATENPTGLGNQPGPENSQIVDNTQGQPQQPTQAPPFQIDPRFANLPQPEAIARTVQSIVTPLNMKIKELSEQSKKFDSYVDSLSLIQENEEARMAFIRELAPDLVKPVDIDEQVKSELDKKYGKDFKPDKEEASTDYWSPSAKYLRDLNRIYSEVEAKSKTSSYKTYAEIKQEVSNRKTAKIKEDEAKIQELKTKFQLDDNTFNSFSNWAKNLKLEDLYYHFKGISAIERQTNLSSVGGTGVTIDQKRSYVDNLFGPNRS